MGFIDVPGLTGKLYVPDEDRKPERKHNCRDCFYCQRCSDDRCALCLKRSVIINGNVNKKNDTASS